MRFALLAVLLTSCATATQPTPTLESLPRLVTTPALEPWVIDQAQAYADAHGPLPFDVDVLPPQAALAAAQEGTADLIVAAIEPQAGWFATPLATEGIAVIVHQDNPSRSFSTEQLADLFSGRIASWEAFDADPLEVQPLIPLAGDEVRQRFETLVLEGNQATTNALQAPSPAIMASMVAEDPGAIGYLLHVDLPEGVNMVRIDGALPIPTNIARGSYSLTLEILALAPIEPAGPLRDWLVWLQASD
jgi:phosphate transport system substrate-binding protein